MNNKPKIYWSILATIGALIAGVIITALFFTGVEWLRQQTFKSDRNQYCYRITAIATDKGEARVREDVVAWTCNF